MILGVLEILGFWDFRFRVPFKGTRRVPLKGSIRDLLGFRGLGFRGLGV